MNPVLLTILIIVAVLLVILVILYFAGRKLQKKQAAQDLGMIPSK